MRHLIVGEPNTLLPRPYEQAVISYVKPAPTHVAHIVCGPFLYTSEMGCMLTVANMKDLSKQVNFFNVYVFLLDSIFSVITNKMQSITT